MKPVNILVAPNSFKNSLTADQACEAITGGLKDSKLHCNPIAFPVGDGGDGTGELLLRKLGATKINCKVHDPLGRIIDAGYGWINNGGRNSSPTAIIEMADASGLRLLKKNELDPLHCSSVGTGELILDALNKGAGIIILCIGGSATADAGMGILEALGMKFFDASRNLIRPSPAVFDQIIDFDDTEMNARMSGVELIILCDVVNYLLGDKGAAAVFGPQKGASAEDVPKLEKAIGHLTELVIRKKGVDMNSIRHGGAAGGVSAGLHALCAAKLVNGIEYFLDLTNFDDALAGAGILITGEGSIDIQTLEGKAPFGVAQRAKARGIPVIGIGGKIPLEKDTVLEEYFDVLIGINNDAMDIESALRNAGKNLRRTSYILGNLLNM